VPICNELSSPWWSPEIGLHRLLRAHITRPKMLRPRAQCIPARPRALNRIRPCFLERPLLWGLFSLRSPKLFGTGSQVPFFSAITSRYRKFMGSITKRVISGSNSNSPNNTGLNRLNTNISITVTTRRSTWQDTPLLLCHRGCQVAYLVHITFLFSPHCSLSSWSHSPTEILEYHNAAGAAQGTWPQG
jgi:hypothetical protein